MSRALLFQDGYDIEEQRPFAGTVEPSLVAGLGEGLAGEPRAEDFMCWYLGWYDLSDVPDWRHAEIAVVNRLQVRPNLGGEDALPAQSPERNMKSP